MSSPQTNQMKVFLVITVTVALVLVYWKQNVPHNNRPCMNNDDSNAYKTFARKHILQGDAPTTNEGWQRYLKKRNLWGRTDQSFIEAPEQDVQRICRGDGQQVKDNLCISTKKMTVHHVRLKISIESVTPRSHPVIVACDTVKETNRCLPVHYEKDDKDTPTNVPCS